MKSHGPGCRRLEDRVGEQKSQASPNSFFASGLELPRQQTEWGGVSLQRRAGPGWARLTPPQRGAGSQEEDWSRGCERTRQREGAMAGASLGARFYRQIKKHPGLIPMIGFIGLGMGSAALYLLRLALRSPDVCWDRKNNPEPWNRLSPNDQYKFFAVSTDYKKLKKDRPDF
ncbi:PREDICTED: NADH dehydrogenase [ubiquinone] 1 alpha subcomplex subunit 4-like 2 [Chinchilla lanigera]|nr:PREDICTED: NADH dehydrogenase [ubiquinone] 1 alpha subcomplex subunit 4-like 2 [Chinchilla lanigera]